jgi:hypothetical protein
VRLAATAARSRDGRRWVPDRARTTACRHWGAGRRVLACVAAPRHAETNGKHMRAFLRAASYRTGRPYRVASRRKARSGTHRNHHSGERTKQPEEEKGNSYGSQSQSRRNSGQTPAVRVTELPFRQTERQLSFVTTRSKARPAGGLRRDSDRGRKDRL